MKFTKTLNHAFNMVVHSKVRSWLTILGIVIGVAAVIAIVSLGEGMQEQMTSQMGDLGGDILTLTAGHTSGRSMFGPRMGPGGEFGSSSQATEEEIVIDRSDVQVLKGISNIALIDTNIRGNVEVSYLGKSGSVSLTGVDQKVWAGITSNEISEGRMLDSADQNVIVIGGRLASTYFDQPLGLNKMITIENSAFRVVGILDDSSTSIYMPIQMAYQVLEDKENDVYDSVVIKVKDEDRLNETIEAIQAKLMNVRHVTEKTKDFTVTSNQAMSETRASMMSSMTAFLLAIAAVSLVVGSVGIANTMFTSVLEKTKEIGIMKAIGARNSDIMLMFLLNAALIGLVGGIIGIVFGILLSGTMGSLMTDLRFFRAGGMISLKTVFIALGVSVGVGIIAGAIPAYQGSKLKPVDALRYE